MNYLPHKIVVRISGVCNTLRTVLGTKCYYDWDLRSASVAARALVKQIYEPKFYLKDNGISRQKATYL